MNAKFRVRCLLEYLLLVGFIQTGLAAQENADHIDVPFVPTPITVVDEMLKIAAVDSEDTLYDLGCGDGRIVIRAAQKTGTPGVGVDIDSIRIDEAWYYAEVAGVAGRVQFHQQDLLQTDLSDATVVTLYLLPEMNFILFPKLFKQLSPGARIVSHDFSMGQWMPDSSTVVFGEYETHMVYLWIIPENVTGHWNWRDPIRDGQKEWTMELHQHFQEVHGKLKDGIREYYIMNAMMVADKLRFSIYLNEQGRDMTVTFDGRVIGNTIEGVIESRSESILLRRTWNATRIPGTAVPIDISNTEL